MADILQTNMEVLTSSIRNAYVSLVQWRKALGTDFTDFQLDSIENCKQALCEDLPGVLIRQAKNGAEAGLDCPKELAAVLMEAASIGKELSSMLPSMVRLDAKVMKMVSGKRREEINFDKLLIMQFTLLIPAEALLSRMVLAMRIGGYIVPIE